MVRLLHEKHNINRQRAEDERTREILQIAASGSALSILRRIKKMENEARSKKSWLETSVENPETRWWLTTVLLAMSLVPLFVMGITTWLLCVRILERNALESQGKATEHLALAIDNFFFDKTQKLQLIARTHEFDHIDDNIFLGDLLGKLNQSPVIEFLGLGIVDDKGKHLAHTGAFESQNQIDWPKIPENDEGYISNVLLDSNQRPQCIVAVKMDNGGAPETLLALNNRKEHILYARISIDNINSQLRSSVLGKRGKVFCLNRQGCYQVSSHDGLLLKKADLPVIGFHRGVRSHRIVKDDKIKFQVTTWLNTGDWVLVSQQDKDDVMALSVSTIAFDAVLALFVVIFVVIGILATTWHVSEKFRKVGDTQKKMSRAFMRSASLASIGEFATGLAHEINNPLAIISAEGTNISDILGELRSDEVSRAELLKSTECIKQQVLRCAAITTKMLQFGRKGDSRLQLINIVPYLRNIINLMKRRANVRNITLELDVQNDHIQIRADPLELEQVLINLVNNAFHALPDGGEIEIASWRTEIRVYLEVRDNGCGIPAEIVHRIFEPFFSTRPAGEGTGLGLSICYGMVRSWGGQIEVESEPNCGTTIRICFPLPDKRESMHETSNKNDGQSDLQCETANNR